MNMRDKEKLRALIRFEIDPDPFSIEQEGLEFPLEYNESYRPGFEDLYAACKNMLVKEIDFDTYLNWFYHITDDLFDYYDGLFEIIETDLYYWPNTDQDLFYGMYIFLDDLCVYEEYEETRSAFSNTLKEIMEMADNYRYNREHDIKDWKLTKLQKEAILTFFSNKSENVSRSRKELFCKIVDEACEADNTDAMLIKGYGCYGGNRIFECDWEESRKWITRLFEKTGNPQYANTLGYIYYYGRCNNGIPEYEKSFQYYSVGAAHDLFESMYKISDMFLQGKGIIKSVKTADHIIQKIYPDSRLQFCHGSDANFADIALRRGAFYERDKIWKEALKCYLEADYAIKKRMKKSNFFGNKKVQDGIQKGIERVKDKINNDYFKDEIISTYPYWIFNFIGSEKTRVYIDHVSENRYQIKLEKIKRSNGTKALLVVPELEAVCLARKFACEFITEYPVKYNFSDHSNMCVDNIKYPQNGVYSFCNGNTVIFEIKDAEFALDKVVFAK